MPKMTMVVGVILVVVGVGGYVGSHMVSPTALIPAWLGLALVGLGGLALKEGLRKHAMHGAVLVGLLGFLGTVSGLAGLVKVMAGIHVNRIGAVYSKSLTAVVCGVFIAVCVQSFIQARRNRQLEAKS